MNAVVPLTNDLFFFVRVFFCDDGEFSCCCFMMKKEERKKKIPNGLSKSSKVKNINPKSKFGKQDCIFNNSTSK